MINKKTKIIFGGILMLILIISLLFLLKSVFKSENNNKVDGSVEFRPEFLTVEEKNNFRISPDVKAQVISRDANGKVKIYKVIKSDNDIVNPQEIGSVR